MKKHHLIAKIVAAVLDRLMISAFIMVAFWPEVIILLGFTVATTVATMFGMIR